MVLLMKMKSIDLHNYRGSVSIILVHLLSRATYRTMCFRLVM
jgi:hypothetical protein